MCALQPTSLGMAADKIRLAHRWEGQHLDDPLKLLSHISGVVDMAMGFPDYPPPAFILEALQEVSTQENFRFHQYTRAFGHPRLVNALANLYSPIYNRTLDSMKEILITIGAVESLFCVLNALVNPGDCAMEFQGFFLRYKTMVEAAGGTPVYVPLRPTKNGEMTSADWKLDAEELAKAFNSKTKIIILNNPHNPVGKVYTRDELTIIADLCIGHNVVCVSDEVYEWIVFPGAEHVRVATLPGMWERTVTISSAGKSFGVTGWELGWTIGSDCLMKYLMIVHTNCVATCPTPNQEAVARALELETVRLHKSTSYFHTLPNVELLPKRNRLADMLRSAGMTPIIPEGSYFMLANWKTLNVDWKILEVEDGIATDYSRDAKFVKWLLKEKKLAVIPICNYYCDTHRYLGEDFVRFCFFKKDSTIDVAEEILKSFE